MRSYEQELDYQLTLMRELGGRTERRRASVEFVRDLTESANALLATMSDEHTEIVVEELEGTGRLSRLSQSFKSRYLRYALGDERPLSLPPVVGESYVLIDTYRWGGWMGYGLCNHCWYDFALLATNQDDFIDCPVCGVELPSRKNLDKLVAPLNIINVHIDNTGKWRVDEWKSPMGLV